jgi:hypothetical protein
VKAPDRLPVGTAIYACPLPECLWSLSESLVADVEFRVNPEVVARSMTSGPYQEAAWKNVEVAINQVAFERAEALEKEIRAHLESHDVLDFVRAIRSLEQQLAQRDSGNRPHRYRDHERDQAARDGLRAAGLTGSYPRDPSLDPDWDQDVDGYGERPR